MKIYTQEELNEILERHKMWLNGKEGGERADLSNTDLRGAKFWGVNLKGANLEGVKLQGASLQGALLPKGFYQVVGCGSIGRCTTYDTINDQVVCGCWDDDNGNHLESFKRRVENIYGEDDEMPNKKYRAQYMAAIRFFEAMREAEGLR